jgi:hypothetical protein
MDFANPRDPDLSLLFHEMKVDSFGHLEDVNRRLGELHESESSILDQLRRRLQHLKSPSLEVKQLRARIQFLKEQVDYMETLLHKIKHFVQPIDDSKYGALCSLNMFFVLL